MKKYFFPKARLNYRLSEFVINDVPLVAEGITYVEMTKRPNGRPTYRKLFNPTTEEKIILLT